MSQLIVPGGRPVPKKEEPKGPITVSWASIVTITDEGMVHVNPYDADFAGINMIRSVVPEDVIGACAMIENMGPVRHATISNLDETDDIFKTAFILAVLPDGRVICLDDLAKPILTTYPGTTYQVFAAAATLKMRITATMAADFGAPLAGQFAAQAVMGTIDQAFTDNQAAKAMQGHG